MEIYDLKLAMTAHPLFSRRWIFWIGLRTLGIRGIPTISFIMLMEKVVVILWYGIRGTRLVLITCSDIKPTIAIFWQSYIYKNISNLANNTACSVLPAKCRNMDHLNNSSSSATILLEGLGLVPLDGRIRSNLLWVE